MIALSRTDEAALTLDDGMHHVMGSKARRALNARSPA
jgi:hypothetical protein